MEIAESDRSTESVILRLGDKFAVCDSALDFENAVLIAASGSGVYTPVGICIYGLRMNMLKLRALYISPPPP
jgi:hypothetical protein